MAGQGIDLFDIYNPFYTDLCTHYPDILGKDIPLKKRILAYYPNIDLCDDNCNLLGVFMNNKTAKCECSLSGEGDKKNSIKDNALYQSQAGQFEEMIDVIKCYKGVFEYKYFKISYGGFIIMGLIIIQIICTVFYYKKSKIHIKKYIFSITNCYFDYLKNKKPTLKIEQQDFKLINIKENNKANVSLPPRRINKAPTGFGMTIKKSFNNENLIANNNGIKIPNNIAIYSIDSKENMNISKKGRAKQKERTYKKINANMPNFKARNSLYNNSTQKSSYRQIATNNLLINLGDDFDANMDEFLKTDPDDMDYDDAIIRDKRTFCKCYCDKIHSEQIIINTFFYKEYLKPLPIKIILLVFQVDLYFFINSLFYNEEYVTKIFELEKDSFSKAFWRFLDNLFYAFLFGIIINYIINYFFIEEKILRVTFKREKDNLLKLKYEMLQIIKDLEKRYTTFIIISFIILLFAWYRISCFNHIYIHMKKEWIIFSVLIIVCIQILSLLTSLLGTIIRFLSFRFKSKKLFKLSLLFS